jgi:hypothetical protein
MVISTVKPIDVPRPATRDPCCNFESVSYHGQHQRRYGGQTIELKGFPKRSRSSSIGLVVDCLGKTVDETLDAIVTSNESTKADGRDEYFDRQNPRSNIMFDGSVGILLEQILSALLYGQGGCTPFFVPSDKAGRGRYWNDWMCFRPGFSLPAR